MYSCCCLLGLNHLHLANLHVDPAVWKRVLNANGGDVSKSYKHFMQMCAHPTDESIELEIISGNHSREAKLQLRLEFPHEKNLEE